MPARFLWLSDAVLMACAFFVTYASFPWLQGFVAPGAAVAHWLSAIGVPLSQGTGQHVRALPELIGIGAVAGLASLAAVDLLGGHRPLLGQSRTRLFLGAVLGPVVGLSVTTIVLFTLRIYDVSRLFLFTFVAFQAFGLATWRLGLRAYKMRRAMAGHYARGVLLIGPTDHLRRLVEHFRTRVPSYAYQVIGGLPADQVDNREDGTVPLPILGRVDDLSEILIRRPIDDVVVVQPSTQSAWLNQVIQECDYFRATLRIVPEALFSMGLRDLRADRESDAMGLPALLLSPSPVDNHPQFMKRVLDILISAAMLALLAPVFAIIAIGIKLTTPTLPIFYRWRVVGYKGREFVGYKFTTMCADADAQRATLDHLNEMQGPVFKIKNDPRTTALGRVLRKYSLNELPQLWSVLRGDMSLVGPRPAFPHELSRYECWHKRKLSVKPGITCLWQVRGRNAISDFDEWVRLDLKYIDNWSLWLDFKILIWTVGAIFKGTGS